MRPWLFSVLITGCSLGAAQPAPPRPVVRPAVIGPLGQPAAFDAGFDVVSLWREERRWLVALVGESVMRARLGVFEVDRSGLAPSLGPPIDPTVGAVWSRHVVRVVPSTTGASPWVITVKTHRMGPMGNEHRWELEPGFVATSFDGAGTPITLAELPNHEQVIFSGNLALADGGTRPVGIVGWRDGVCMDPPVDASDVEIGTTDRTCRQSDTLIGATLLQEAGPRAVTVARIPASDRSVGYSVAVAASGGRRAIAWWNQQNEREPVVLHSARIGTDGAVQSRRQQGLPRVAHLTVLATGLTAEHAFVLVASRMLSRSERYEAVLLDFDATGAPIRESRLREHVDAASVVTCGTGSWAVTLAGRDHRTTLRAIQIRRDGSAGTASTLWRSPAGEPQWYGAMEVSWAPRLQLQTACDGDRPAAAIVHTQLDGTSALVLVSW